MAFTIWISVALLILANALYVSAEFGGVSAPRSRVRRLADDGRLSARRLLPFIQNPAALTRYISTSQIGITLSSLILGAYAQATFGLRLAPALGGWLRLDAVTARSASEVAVLILITAAQLVLGELVPKAIALRYPTEVALFTVWPMRWSLTLFRPFIAALNGTAALLLRLLGARLTTHRHIHSPDEIELLLAESRDGGLLEPEEQQRLHRALRLGLRSARDLMVPLEKLTMLGAETSWDEVVRTVAASPYSRLPVYRGARDRVIGTLRVKDLVYRFVTEGPLPLDRLIHPVVEVGDDVPADQIVGVLRGRRAHQAVVVDAGKRAVGLVTIQDVLGELLRPEAGAPRAGGSP